MSRLPNSRLPNQPYFRKPFTTESTVSTEDPQRTARGSFPICRFRREIADRVFGRDELEALRHPAFVTGFDESQLYNWLSLQNAVFRPSTRPWTQADFQRELVARSHWNPDHLLLARWSSDLLGSVYLEVHPGEQVAQVHWLAVANDARRQSIGTLLMEKARQLAAAHGATFLQAETLARWHSAIGFYQRLGFERLD